MANGRLTRLVENYRELQQWTQSNDPLRERFVLGECSLDNTNHHPIAEAATNRPECLEIYGKIVPLAEFQTKKLVKIKIELPILYPHAPPSIFLESSIQHPNVDHTRN